MPDLTGVFVTADALHTQQKTCRYLVRDKGGHYVLTVKDNQPGLKKRIEELLKKHEEQVRIAHTQEQGHGRDEYRRIEVMTTDAQEVLWPFASQIGRIYRQRMDLKSGKLSQETVYIISSANEQEASATKLLALNRGHWGVENRLHYTKDRLMDEDRCRSSHPTVFRILSSIRSMTVLLLRKATRSIKQSRTRLASRVHEAVALVSQSDIFSHCLFAK
jgi:predicted transposase YbfD/YdcC